MRPLLASADPTDADGVDDARDDGADVEDPSDGDRDRVGEACDDQLEIGEEDLDRMTRGQVTRDSVLPLPPACVSCPFEVREGGMEKIVRPVAFMLPQGVTAKVVREDGAVVGRLDARRAPPRRGRPAATACRSPARSATTRSSASRSADRRRGAGRDPRGGLPPYHSEHSE